MRLERDLTHFVATALLLLGSDGLAVEPRSALTECVRGEVAHAAAGSSLDERFESFQQRYPLLHRYIRSPASRRWLRSKDPSWRDLHHQVVSCLPGRICRIQIDGNDFEFNGSAAFSESEELNLNINSFRVKTVDPETGRKAAVNLGERGKGLDTSFGNLMGVLIQGADELIQRHDEIKMLRIRGNLVVNSHLEKQLAEFGFKARETRREAIPLEDNGIPKFWGLFDRWRAQGSGSQVRIGNSWILELPVANR